MPAVFLYTDMRISFKHYMLVEQDFQSFQQYLQQSGVTFPQLLQKLQAGKPTGKGGNADFFKIPGSDFGIRIVRGAWGQDDSKMGVPPQLEPAHDPHAGENVGQPVATYGSNIQVLRLQSGKPAGMPYGYDKKDPTAETEAVETFRQQLTHAAEMPDAEYERLMVQILKLNQNGYAVDPSKSGNLLIDPHSGRFNLVDLNPQPADAKYRNNAGDIIVMLMGNHAFSNHFHSDPEMQAAAQQIIKKVETASTKTGLPLKKSSSVDFSYSLANGKYKPTPPPPPETTKPAGNGWGSLDVW